MSDDSATEQSIFIQTQSDEKQGWNKQKIIDSLIKETTISHTDADFIAGITERKLLSMELPFYTSDLIREMVNMYLLEYGFGDICVQYQRIGIPLYDIETRILNHNKENSNVPKGPEATNLSIAGDIKKKFALFKVFSKDISDAYLDGKIHLHNLDMVDRPYCGGQNPAYVAKFGLDFPTSMSAAKPAKTAEIFIDHIVKHSAMLQGSFAGAIGWDAINTFVSPYLEGYDYKRIKQCAQGLIFEFAQQAVARGGQSTFSDLNIYFNCPPFYADVDAIGPGGVPTGKKYKDYIKEAKLFAKALFEVYLEGDKYGKPFFFPKSQVHICEGLFDEPDHDDFMTLICKVAAEKGNTYFVFDRTDDPCLAQCCRLKIQLRGKDVDEMSTPWKVRHSALNIVTINLPRMAVEAVNEDELMRNISDMILLGVRANVEKREFIRKLLSQGKNGNLATLCMNHDEEPYLRIDRAKGLIGMVGLNECVQIMTGDEMHESRDSTLLGLKIISHMKKECERLAEEFGMETILEQTPAESTAYRFAKMDLNRFPKIKNVVKGNVETGDVYYTNSSYINVGADVSVIDRIKTEGKFHPFIPAGSMTHVWLGEYKPDVEGIKKLVIKTFENTNNAQISFSPEFTTCNDCGNTGRGMQDSCENCGSKDVDFISRVTGYLSRMSSWNPGKWAELKDRHRNNI